MSQYKERFMVNKLKVAMPTKEQIEYEDAKKDFRIATAKARLHSAGIDPSKISKQAIDKVIRIFDDMDHVQQDTQQKTSKLQRDVEFSIQKVNQDANQKFNDLQRRYQDLITSLKGNKKEELPQVDDVTGSNQTNVDMQAESTKEEIREKTYEEKVAEITNILLNHLRDPVSQKVNEIMCMIDEKADETVTKGSDNKEETTQSQIENKDNIVDSEANIQKN